MKSLAALLLLLPIAACPKAKKPQPEPPTPLAIQEDLPSASARRLGPLSFSKAITATPEDAVRKAQQASQAQLIDKAGISADMGALLKVAKESTQEPNAEALVAAQNYLKSSLAKAPLSIADFAKGLEPVAKALGICSQPAGQNRHCYEDLFRAEPVEGGPFTLTNDKGVALIRVSDLTQSSQQAWELLAPAWAKLVAGAPPQGIVLDMRDARGDDPTVLLAWFYAMAGIKELHPLRAVHSPDSLTHNVNNYLQHYLADSRNEEIWQGLATAKPEEVEPGPMPPIAVVTGAQCQSACELIARVLETYGHATIVGGVPVPGLLHRARPARMQLPYSGVRLYFFGSEFLLSEAIEAATGPTSKWASVGDSLSFDGTAFAIKEVRMRAKLSKAWPPRCDSLKGYKTKRAMPISDRSKLKGDFNLKHCDAAQRATSLHSELPFTAVRRLLRTCSTPVEITSYEDNEFQIRSSSQSILDQNILSQIAQQKWVEFVDIQCSASE